MPRLLNVSRILKLSAIALLSLFFLAPGASAQGRFRGGYVGWYGPGWGWYGPYAWGWGYPYGYSYGPNSGQVKLQNVPKDTIVYVDGGYAGTAGNLKKFALRPGNHDIELRDPSGHAFQKERVHVIPGKTLEVRGTAGGR